MKSVLRLIAAALLTAACSSQPGEQAASPTTGEAAGRPDWFHVSLRYVNDPGLDWSGIPLGPHEAGAMEKVRASTPCTVVSNRVRVERP